MVEHRPWNDIIAYAILALLGSVAVVGVARFRRRKAPRTERIDIIRGDGG